MSAGCGLVALVLASCGARQVNATDIEDNLALLRENCETNVPGKVQVSSHAWGAEIDEPLQINSYDLITACDLMYIRESEVLAAFIKSLSGLLSVDGRILMAHGRNRGGEEFFRNLSSNIFDWEEIEQEYLHETYRCSDVRVVNLKHKKR